MIRIVLLITATCLSTGTAQAQHLLAQDALSGEFYSIDLHSGEASPLGGSGVFLTTYDAMATNLQGVVYSVSYHLQTGQCQLHTVDPATGQRTYVVDILERGISAIAFGPGDVLYALLNLSYPIGSAPQHLATIHTVTGAVTVIGQAAPSPSAMLAMDFDGITMYAWDNRRGLMTLDLITGLGTEVNPGFIGSAYPHESMCFGDDGTLYLVDGSHWIIDPTTGVTSYVAANGFPGVFGGVEYIPGPNQVLSLWQTEEVGNPTEVKIRGATPGADVALFLSFGDSGSTTIPAGFPCAGSIIDLNPTTLRYMQTISADSQGEASIGPFIMPAAGRLSAQLQALDLTTCATSNPIRAVW